MTVVARIVAAMTTRVDVLVCGAGPAGTAAALAARQANPRASVLLLDRAAFPRDKVCGDGVGPHAGDVLAELGVAHVVEDRERFSSYRLCGPGGAEVTATSARTGWVVPRHEFDARLVTAATDAGADFARHRVRSMTVGDDRVVVDDAYEARVVVGADGANSVVRRATGAASNPPAHRAVALRGYATRPSGLDEMYFAWDGASGLAYTWAFPTADTRVNVGYIRLASARTEGRRGLQRALTQRLPHLPARAGTLAGHTLPLSSRRPDPAPHPRVLLVGDAASLINPLSGEGIYYALASGALAGAATVADDPGSVYRTSLRARYARHWRDTRVAAAALHVPGAVRAGLLAARQQPALLESLIDLTLGDGTLSGRGAVRAAAGLARHVARPGAAARP